ncbi:MAG TPA: LysE family translocator [Bacteroidales bacterium]|jgi:threonine/homoserine/homoserine lactone efflux protein|nr:LysE family translocator [Bacteroidales bacterium]
MLSSILLEGIIIGILVSIPMGPIGVLCVQRTVHQGRRSGLISGLGAAVADSSFAFIAGFGLTFLTDFFKSQQFYLMFGGAIVLIFLGFRLFFTDTIKEVKKYRIQRANPYTDFMSVFLLTLSNPITILFFGLVFTGLGVVKENIVQTGTLIGGIFLGAICWWFILTTVVSYFRNLFKIRIIFWINKVAGMLIVLFGALAMFNAFYPQFNNEKIQKSPIVNMSNKLKK